MARIRALIAQFHVKKRIHIPQGLPDHGQHQNSGERALYLPDTRPINERGPAEEGTHCNIHNLRDLERDYILTEGYSFWRGTEHFRTYYIRFIFMPRHLSVESETENTDGILGALMELSTQALWSAKIWRNLYISQDAAEGDLSISVNLYERSPFVGRDGKQIVQWRRDGQGNAIGTAPVPIIEIATLRLEIHDAMPRIVPVTEEVADAAAQ